jgi:hypothetical protein
MWRHVGLLWIDISEEHVASIFMVEEITRARKGLGGYVGS